MKKLIVVISVFLGFVGLTLLSSVATSAQPYTSYSSITTVTPPPGVNCGENNSVVKVWTFDNDAEDWTAPAGTSWLSQKSFGWPIAQTAYGIVQPNAYETNFFRLRNDLYLQPAIYKIVVKAANDAVLFGDSSLAYFYWDDNTSYPLGYSSLGNSWNDYFFSQPFQIIRPDSYTLYMSAHQRTYFDYICLVADPYAATPTPYAGANTVTPTPAGTNTPIPTQSTPLPTPTTFCEFATPTQEMAMPNATPVFTSTANLWSSLITDFRNTQKIGAVSANANNHTPWITDGSMKVGYSDNSSSTPANAALFFSTGGYTMSAPFYLSIWAKADNVPINTTAKVFIWGKPFTSSTYLNLGEIPVSAQLWYHGDLTIHTSIETIAVRSSRTDNPATGGVYIDDFYIYGDSSLRPLCDGYPPGMFGNNTDGGRFYEVLWPTDKPCPQGIRSSNNFWGPLIEAFQTFGFSIFRDADGHQADLFNNWARTTLLEPIVSIFLYASMLFNWFWPLTFISLVSGSFVLYLVILGWKALKRTVVPTN